jgi:hypothetical protein
MRAEESRPLRHLAATITAFARLIVIVCAGLLLTSIAGAAVYAAPITLPLLALIAATSRGAAWRVAAIVVSALTFLEVAWMLAWTQWKNPLGTFLVATSAALVLASVAWNSTRHPRTPDA